MILKIAIFIILEPVIIINKVVIISTDRTNLNKLVKYLLYIAFYSKEKSMSQSVSERTRIKVTVTNLV
jgi:hypothetical protein